MSLLQIENWVGSIHWKFITQQTSHELKDAKRKELTNDQRRTWSLGGTSKSKLSWRFFHLIASTQVKKLPWYKIRMGKQSLKLYFNSNIGNKCTKLWPYIHYTAKEEIGWHWQSRLLRCDQSEWYVDTSSYRFTSAADTWIIFKSRNQQLNANMTKMLFVLTHWRITRPLRMIQK